MARKTWCFTWNNYMESDILKLQEYIGRECEYAIYGKEKAPDTGTHHLQGYLYLKTKKRLGTLKTEISTTPHWEASKGTPQQNKDYCSKEGDAWEFGTLPGTRTEKSGEKTKERWNKMIELAKEGNWEELEREYPKETVQYKRTWREINLEALKQERHDEWNDDDLKSHFWWIQGSTGSGKSHVVHEIAKMFGEQPYPKGLHKWWNGYRKQRVIHVEEATPKAMEYLGHYMKQWADKWGFQPEVKNSFIDYVVPEFFIVTSNYSLADCFPNAQDYEPLARRFTQYELNTRDDQQFVLDHFRQFIATTETTATQEGQTTAGNKRPRDETDLTTTEPDQCSTDPSPLGNTIAKGLGTPKNMESTGIEPEDNGNTDRDNNNACEEVIHKRSRFVEETLDHFPQ